MPQDVGHQRTGAAQRPTGTRDSFPSYRGAVERQGEQLDAGRLYSYRAFTQAPTLVEYPHQRRVARWRDRFVEPERSDASTNRVPAHAPESRKDTPWST